MTDKTKCPKCGEQVDPKDMAPLDWIDKDSLRVCYPCN